MDNASGDLAGWQVEWARKAVEAVRRGERVQLMVPKGAIKRRIIAEAKAWDELLDRENRDG